MSVLISFTPAEEAQLADASRRTGLAPAEWIKRLALEHLPNLPAQATADLDTKLRQWQEQDGTPLMPNVPTATLFAEWAEEDARMTDEEREAEDRLWKEIETSISKNRGVSLRQFGS